MRLLLILLISVPLWATNYFVSATGSDSNNGTSSGTPWQTVSKVNGFSFSAGDTISFKGGNSFAGPLTPTLTGSSGSVITVNSYGTGQATITAGAGVVDGISLTNPKFVTITGLTITGAGWTGSGLTLVPVNGGAGIRITGNLTTGPQLDGVTISNNVISGCWYGIVIDASASASVVGFQNISITGNTLSNNVSFGVDAHGYNSYAGGPQNQFTNFTVSGNTIQNLPGDPNSGNGGVDQSFKSEAGGIDVGNATNLTISGNYMTDIGGYGGALSGLTLGGSASIVASGSTAVTINSNEIARTACSTHFDGSAIDLDANVQNAEVAFNLTYNNVGPSVQFGSFGGFVTSNIKIHHNISYNDVRGNNSGGLSEQGAIRLWGGTDQSYIFNNTLFVDYGGVVGIPSAISFEGNGIANTNVYAVNNILRTTGGIAGFYSNRTNIITTHMGAITAVGNIYDLSDPMLISNDNGTAAVDITTLAAWRALGYEVYSAVNYGSTGAAYLRNLALFSPPSNGFLNNGGIASVANFNLGGGTSAAAEGIDPSLLGITLGSVDYHGNPSSRSGLFDAGAVSFLSYSPITGH